MAKKLLCILVCVVMLFAFTSCKNKITMDNGTGSVVNGGFATETDSYLYFINGSVSRSTTYKTGDVVKGALMRVKKSELNNPSTATYETVVSKPIVSDDTNAGFYIIGEYVYYAVPATTKDSFGSVESDRLQFFKTKLDAKETKEIKLGEEYSHVATFRFLSSGSKVYLAVYEDTLTIYELGKGKKATKVYPETSAQKSRVDALDEIKFGTKDGENYIVYTVKPYNPLLSATDTYHEVFRIKVGNKIVDEKIMDGRGIWTMGNEGNRFGGIGIDGATVDLIQFVGQDLYFSYSYTVAGMSDKITEYRVANVGDFLKVDDNLNTASEYDNNVAWTNVGILLNGGNDKGSIAVSETMIPFNTNSLLYLNTTYGLMVYDYTVPEGSERGESILFKSDVLKGGAVLDFIDGDYLYYHNSSNFMYRLNVGALLDDDDTNDDVKEYRITRLGIKTGWYKPEVIKLDDKELLLTVYTDSNYYSYVYYTDMGAMEKGYDDAVAEGTESSYYIVKSLSGQDLLDELKANVLGKISSEDESTILG